MRRVVEILAILSIILIILSMVITLPWPANIIIGIMLLSALVVDLIDARKAKKRQQDINQPDIPEDSPLIYF